jgi:hypothetical protein
LRVGKAEPEKLPASKVINLKIAKRRRSYSGFTQTRLALLHRPEKLNGLHGVKRATAGNRFDVS